MRWVSNRSKHDYDTVFVPDECLGWAVEPLLDVLLYAAVVPSPEGAEE